MFLEGPDLVFLVFALVKAVAVALVVLTMVPGSVTAERRLSAWIRIGSDQTEWGYLSPIFGSSGWGRVSRML